MSEIRKRRLVDEGERVEEEQQKEEIDSEDDKTPEEKLTEEITETIPEGTDITSEVLDSALKGLSARLMFTSLIIAVARGSIPSPHIILSTGMSLGGMKNVGVQYLTIAGLCVCPCNSGWNQGEDYNSPLSFDKLTLSQMGSTTPGHYDILHELLR
uniref:Uncharacterized protein n=1 Tax=Timema cristinae TaxID=61476 RepID=A0A7R9GPB5_TIMCR|nr:unnamed protein product [Timema cristinae]